MNIRKPIFHSGYFNNSEIRQWIGRLKDKDNSKILGNVIESNHSKIGKALSRTMKTPRPKIVLKGMNRKKK